MQLRPRGIHSNKAPIQEKFTAVKKSIKKYREINMLNFQIIKHLKDFKKLSPVVIAKIEVSKRFIDFITTKYKINKEAQHPPHQN